MTEIESGWDLHGFSWFGGRVSGWWCKEFGAALSLWRLDVVWMHGWLPVLGWKPWRDRDDMGPRFGWGPAVVEPHGTPAGLARGEMIRQETEREAARRADWSRFFKRHKGVDWREEIESLRAERDRIFRRPPQ